MMHGNREEYEKYRWFFTSSGKIVVGGKSSKQNEELMRSIENEDIIMHTSTPGSPFCIIKNPNKKDIEETAIFTGCFSHEWKKAKKRAEIHIFKGEQVIKKKGMEEGTFGILGSVNTIRIDLKLALDFQKGKIRALPLSAAKKKLLILKPGKMDKIDAARQIVKIMKEKYSYPASLEEVMSAIPSGNIKIEA